MLHCGQTHSLRIHISWICTTLPSWILVGQVWIYTEPVLYEIEIFLVMSSIIVIVYSKSITEIQKDHHLKHLEREVMSTP